MEQLKQIEQFGKQEIERNQLKDTVQNFEDVLIEIEILKTAMQILNEYFSNSETSLNDKMVQYDLKQRYTATRAISRLITDKLDNLHKDGYNYLDNLKSGV